MAEDGLLNQQDAARVHRAHGACCSGGCSPPAALALIGADHRGLRCGSRRPVIVLPSAIAPPRPVRAVHAAAAQLGIHASEVPSGVRTCAGLLNERPRRSPTGRVGAGDPGPAVLRRSQGGGHHRGQGRRRGDGGPRLRWCCPWARGQRPGICVWRRLWSTPRATSCGGTLGGRGLVTVHGEPRRSRWRTWSRGGATASPWTILLAPALGPDRAATPARRTTRHSPWPFARARCSDGRV
ncbi:hypothetical protein QJS66_10015 [Kocuria rhizophila]|nr:hypothetical protein QJS66_10015 [Kocuria rhizophila]